MAAVPVAQVVPQNVEKLPLFHWRPGARALVVGARDGASFDGGAAADDGSFKRNLDDQLLTAALKRSACDAVAAAWGNSLRESSGLDLLRACGHPLIVIASGHADPQMIIELAPEVAAWLLLVGDEAAPAAASILEQGAHVEVLWAVDESLRRPDLPWERAKALHICNRRQADPTDRYETARALLPAELAVYDSRHQHSLCPHCGDCLVWRSGGRSRLDTLAGSQAICRSCAASLSNFTLS